MIDKQLNKTPKFKPIVKCIQHKDDVEGTSEYELLLESGPFSGEEEQSEEEALLRLFLGL